METYEKQAAEAERFWKSKVEDKYSAVAEMLAKKEYAKLYSIVMAARVIDNTFAKSFGDMFFDKFIALTNDIKLSNKEILPFLLHCITSFDAASSWKGCASSYLEHLCKIDYQGIIEYATDNPGAAVWRALAQARPEKTTDIMLELLLEKKGKGKTVLREVLSETKLDVVGVLEESYPGAPLPEKVGIIRLLLMFKKDAEAVRVIEKIKAQEKSLTVLRLLGLGEGGLDFKTTVYRDEKGIFIVRENDEFCAFNYSGDDIVIISESPKGSALAKKAVKTRAAFFYNSFHTGDPVEVFAFAEAVSSDGLFALMAEKYVYSIYSSAGYPVKLFSLKDGEFLGFNCEIDAESDELMAVAHPAELADSTLLSPEEGFLWQFKRDCFLPSKEEMRRSSIPAFTGAMVDLDGALKRAAERGIKVTTAGEINYFNVKWGEYYCVNTFSVLKDTISLGNASFYDYSKLPVTGNVISLKGAEPVSVEAVPARIFSEFLSCIYYIMRGKEDVPAV